MIKLFNLEDYKVTVEPEALTLIPLKRVWDKDKSKDKEKAQQEFAYIFFMDDPRSDYMYIIDENKRSEEVKKGLGLPDKWVESKELTAAREFYRSFKPTHAALLEDARYAVDKFRKLIREIDLNALDDKGKPIYNLSTIPDIIRKIPELVETLSRAEKTINKDIMQENKARGSQRKSLLEDDFDS